MWISGGSQQSFIRVGRVDAMCFLVAESIGPVGRESVFQVLSTRLNCSVSVATLKKSMICGLV